MDARRASGQDLSAPVNLSFGEHMDLLLTARAFHSVLSGGADAISHGDRLAEGDRYHPFRGFPRGRCGVASEYMGRYILLRYRIDLTLVYAESVEQAGSHAWLEADGSQIVDLTVAQFPTWRGESPYVGADRTWHDTRFRVERRRSVTALESVAGYVASVQESFQAVTCAVDAALRRATT